MKGLWILVFLLALALVGCEADRAETQATPTASPESAMGDEPRSSATPGEPSMNTAGNGSSPRQSGGRSVSQEANSPRSSGEGADQEKSTPEKQDLAANPVEWRKKHFKPRPFSEFKELRGYEEVSRLLPQPPSPTRVESGKRLYDQACVACHNLDGSPVNRDPALMKYNMADLSQPQQYLYGSSPKAVYRSIRYGVPSPPMGFTGEIYSQTQVWDMVNYIQSIQRKSLF